VGSVRMAVYTYAWVLLCVCFVSAYVLLCVCCVSLSVLSCVCLCCVVFLRVYSCVCYCDVLCISHSLHLRPVAAVASVHLGGRIRTKVGKCVNYETI
jgi:hypothetical protein